MKSSLALAGLLSLSAASASAVPVTTLTSYFNAFNFFAESVSNPAATDFSAPIGTGTLDYFGTPLADGVYSYSDFAGLALSITFQISDTTIVFTEADLVAPAGGAGLQVLVANNAFHFVGAGSSEAEGGSTLFQNNAGWSLSTSPSDFNYFAYMLISDSESQILGLYGTPETALATPVPEPGSFALLAGAGALAWVGARRRRAAA